MKFTLGDILRIIQHHHSLAILMDRNDHINATENKSVTNENRPYDDVGSHVGSMSEACRKFKYKKPISTHEFSTTCAIKYNLLLPSTSLPYHPFSTRAIQAAQSNGNYLLIEEIFVIRHLIYFFTKQFSR